MKRISIKHLRPSSRKTLEKLLCGHIVSDPETGISYTLVEYNPNKLTKKKITSKKSVPGDPANIDKIYGILSKKPVFEEGGVKYQRKMREGLSRKIIR